MKTVLVADIGSSSVKAGVVALDGAVVSSVRIRFDASLPFPLVWLDALKKAFSCVLRDERMSPRVCPSALLVSGAGPTLVSVDDGGAVSAHLFWDSPVPEVCAPPSPQKPPQSSAAESGSPSIFLPRLLAFRALFPDKTEAARRIFSGPEFAVYCLSGGEVSVLPESRYAPAYWSAELLEANGFRADIFPPFAPPGFCAGRFSPDDTHTPYTGFFRGVLPEDMPVLAGPPDFVSALLGTATVSPGTACDRAGTSEGLNVCVAAPVFANGLRTLPSPVPGLWNVSRLLPDTGLRFRTFRASSPEYAFLPYDALIREGYESPVTPPPGAALNPVREVAEKIAVHVRDGIEKLAEAVGGIPAFTLSGGQAKNPLWNQMKADVTGSVFLMTQTADAELLGDAVISFCALGEYSSYEEACGAMVKICRRFEPNPIFHAEYEKRLR